RRPPAVRAHQRTVSPSILVAPPHDRLGLGPVVSLRRRRGLLALLSPGLQDALDGVRRVGDSHLSLQPKPAGRRRPRPAVSSEALLVAVPPGRGALVARQRVQPRHPPRPPAK